LLAVFGLQDLEALLSQVVVDELADIRLVFDDKIFCPVFAIFPS
jgi:hypothetical protein